MKNKRFWEFLDKKGFYVVLFACVATVIVTAGVITMNNLNTLNKFNEEQQYADLNSEFGDFDLQAVDQNDQEKTLFELSEEDATGIGAAAVQAELRLAGTEVEIPGVDPKVVEAKEPVLAQKETPTAQVEKNEAVQEVAVTTQKPVEQNTEKETKPKEQSKEENKTVGFKDGEKMAWPVVGQIVMDYNADHPVVYDKTLDQYKTHTAVCIAAPGGTQVKAAASGTVESIIQDPIIGYTVTIDHGNGWKTTYGQLQENIMVREQQTVESGQVLGGVGTPTRARVLLNEHLDFKVVKGDTPVSPTSILEP